MARPQGRQNGSGGLQAVSGWANQKVGVENIPWQVRTDHIGRVAENSSGAEVKEVFERFKNSLVRTCFPLNNLAGMTCSRQLRQPSQGQAPLRLQPGCASRCCEKRAR